MSEMSSPGSFEMASPQMDECRFNAEASMPLTAAKGAKKKADDLFSKIIRSLGFCQACASTRDLQCAHIISRRYSATRCDLDNALCLCAKCHFHFTDWPLEFADFVEHTIGLQAYEALVRKAMGREKVNWSAEVERLKPLLDASL